MGGNHGYPDTTGTYGFEPKILRRHPTHWGMPHSVDGLRRSSTNSCATFAGRQNNPVSNSKEAGAGRMASGGDAQEMRSRCKYTAEIFFENQ